ncbi:MAG: PH domain-containing protein [Alphaproteobacteria bacterium]|nr:PH domain-containing protein [Alphaproteobacteria bacterium]
MFDGYIKGSLSQDEKIKVRAYYHWVKWLEFYFIFLIFGGIAFICLLLGYDFYNDKESELSTIMIVLAAMMSIYPLYLFLELRLTEMACTTRRVIFKTGIVSVQTSEIKIDKIESIQIEQSFWGRILGYGNISFSGTGTARVDFKYVSSPWRVKPEIEDVIDEVLKNKEKSPHLADDD